MNNHNRKEVSIIKQLDEIKSIMLKAGEKKDGPESDDPHRPRFRVRTPWPRNAANWSRLPIGATAAPGNIRDKSAIVAEELPKKAAGDYCSLDRIDHLPT
jgi:hypothetical protein